MKTIYFDMDGTIANFYGVSGWLDYLTRYDATPYAIAKPLVNTAVLTAILNALQHKGYRIGIISWLSKTGTAQFNAEVTAVKREWLATHFGGVRFDEIHIVPYGTPKQMFAHSTDDVLFDDEQRNRDNWTGIAYDVDNIVEILKEI